MDYQIKICDIHNENVVSVCLKKECETKKILCYKCIINNHITNHCEKDFEVYSDYLIAFNEFISNKKLKDESQNLMIYKENLITILGDYKNKISLMFQGLIQKLETEYQNLIPIANLKLEDQEFNSYEEISKYIKQSLLKYNKEEKIFYTENKNPFDNSDIIHQQLMRKKEQFDVIYINLKNDFNKEFMNKSLFSHNNLSDKVINFKNPHFNIIEIQTVDSLVILRKISKTNSHYSVISENHLPNDNIVVYKLKILKVNHSDRFLGFGIIDEKVFTGLSSIYGGIMYWGYGMNRFKGNLTTTISNDDRGINNGSEFICTFNGPKSTFEIKSVYNPIVSLVCDDFKGKNVFFCVNFYYETEISIEII